MTKSKKLLSKKTQVTRKSKTKPKILKEEKKHRIQVKHKEDPCICHTDKWCEKCYGDFDLFDI